MPYARSAGVLLPISSLPSPYGVGDLGPMARHWIDQLSAAQQRYWQVLPFHPGHADFQYSPYSSLSAFAGAELYISPEGLVEAGYLDSLPPTDSFRDNSAAYGQAEAFKKELIDQALEKLPADSSTWHRFQAFCDRAATWLEPYVHFRALAEQEETIAWPEWPKKWRSYESARKQFAASADTKLERLRFGQFLFFEQWDSLRRYAQKKGVHLIGDIPIYVHHYSADVWARPELFKLRASGKAWKVAGVPPDYFSKDGQLWGNPVYDWPTHADEQFSWWVHRLRNELACFDLVRIDHFLGLVQYWEVDARAETAKNGRYQKVPKEAFLKAVQQQFPSMPFLAEDLGSVTAEANLTMARYGLPGMRVLHFAFSQPANNDNAYLPHNYPPNTVAYTGTHDNNTTRGWWRQDLDANAKAHLADYLGREPSEETVAHALIRLLYQSNANLVIVPYQDLLQLDETGRLNRPGTTQGNWAWRMDTADLAGLHWQQLADWVTLYRR